MRAESPPADALEAHLQPLAVEEFFYFCLRLRNSEVRRVAQLTIARYPDENPEQIAHRLINSKGGLSPLGGALSMTAVTRLIGWSVIRLYSSRMTPVASGTADPVADPGAMPA